MDVFPVDAPVPALNSQPEAAKIRDVSRILVALPRFILLALLPVIYFVHLAIFSAPGALSGRRPAMIRAIHTCFHILAIVRSIQAV